LVQKLINNACSLADSEQDFLVKNLKNTDIISRYGDRFIAEQFSGKVALVTGGGSGTEAAQLGRRFNAQFRRYYDRKAAQTNTIVATRALSNKIARICYYVIRDQVVFNPKLVLY
jgi:hypothetical protein